MTSRDRGKSFVLGVVVTTAIVIATAGATLAVQGVSRFVATDRQPVNSPVIRVKVESGDLRSVVVGSLAVTPATQIAVSATGVVTRPGVSADKKVESGGAITVVDERPIFLITGDVPLFRDLRRGDVGRDVQAVQKALVELGYSIDTRELTRSIFDRSTASAVYAFYIDRGFQPVDADGSARTPAQIGTTGLRKREVVTSPHTPLTARTACGHVRQHVDGAVCNLEGGPYAMTVTVSTPEATNIRLGMVVSGSGGAIGTITARAPELESSPSTGAETDQRPSDAGASFLVSPAKGVSVGPQQAGTVEVLLAEARKVATVDAIALRGAPGRTWLELASGERVDVTVGLCVTGRCQVTGVAIGAEVVVPSTAPSEPPR